MDSHPGKLSLDFDVLVKCGLGRLGDEDAKELLREIYSELELRVGSELVNMLTGSQLEEFEKLFDVEELNSNTEISDQDEASLWLQTNIPDYPEVVAKTLETMISELSKRAPDIARACGVDYLDPPRDS